MNVSAAPIFAGLILGLGIFLILRALLPAQPDLASALRTQRGPADVPLSEQHSDLSGLAGIVGVRVYPLLANRSWIKIPHKDLALIRMSVPQYLGEKVGLALVGLLWPPLVNLLIALSPSGPMSWSLSIGASLVLAVAFSFIPDAQIRQKAEKARDTFARHLSAYIEMVALVRANGSGTADSLNQAAVVGDSWTFLRLQEELQKADTSHRAAWDALRILAEEIDAPDLNDFADQLVLTGQGVSIYNSMRATAAGLRNKLLSKEQSDATSATKRLRLPLGVMALIFAFIIIYPAGSAMLSAG